MVSCNSGAIRRVKTELVYYHRGYFKEFKMGLFAKKKKIKSNEVLVHHEALLDELRVQKKDLTSDLASLLWDVNNKSDCDDDENWHTAETFVNSVIHLVEDKSERLMSE